MANFPAFSLAWIMLYPALLLQTSFVPLRHFDGKRVYPSLTEAFDIVNLRVDGAAKAINKLEKAFSLLTIDDNAHFEF